MSDLLPTMPAPQNEVELLEEGVPAAPGAAVRSELPQTIGQRLRAAREASRLSVQDVAQSLKYSPRQIELIETDNYAALPGNTVVRGFVRSYARFLRLEPEMLVGMLDERLPKLSADVRPPENMGEAAQPGEEKQVPAIVAVAIVLALTALLLMLWHFFGPSSVRPTVSTSGAVGGVSSQPAPAMGQQASKVAPPMIIATGGAEEGVSRSPVTVAAPNEGLPPQLSFYFEGRAWLEVTDATNKLIHTGENPSGSQLSLNGQPPFDIVVGNATKVRLTYRERSIDLVPHTRADVARLKLE